jgi:hypothetical protein
MSQKSSVTSLRRAEAGAISETPQPLQKRAPAGFSAPHVEHTAIVQA